MMMKWALRELGNHKKFSLFYIFNFTLGLLGLLVLNSVQNSLETATEIKAKEILTADFSIYARRILGESELKKLLAQLPAPFQASRRLSLYTMIVKPREAQESQESKKSGESRLVQLTGIENSYPFYGQITLDLGPGRGLHEMRGGMVAGPFQELQQQKGLWVPRELAVQWRLQVGDPLVVDGEEWKVLGIIQEDSTNLSAGFALAPRAYTSLPGLLATQLVSSKSTLYDHWTFKFAAPVDLHRLRVDMEKKVPDRSIQFADPLKAARRTHSTFGRINDYLNLVALVATFLSALGAIYLVQNYVEKKRKNVAILKSLGMTPVKIQGLYLFHLTLLGLSSAVLGLMLTWAILPQLEKLFVSSLNMSFSLTLNWQTLVFALLLGTLGGVLVGLPSLLRLNQVNVLQLLKGDLNPTHSSWGHLWAYLPGIVALWGMSVYLSHSYFTGSLFFFSLLGCFLGFSLFAWIITSLLGRWQVGSVLLRLTIKGISRRKAAFASTMVALGLSILLLNLIPILESSLREEVNQPAGAVIPSYFLFDIQEEQIGDMQSFLAGHQLQLENLSPLISARILKVRGEDFERMTERSSFQTREEEREGWVRNRSYNLTYSLPGGGVEKEEIVEGRPFSGPYQGDGDKPMEVSMEVRFAQRMKVEVGDEILFDIQGVQFPARVVNLRKVRWTTMRPNFFIKVQPGSLDEAPKSFLAVIRKNEGRGGDEVQYLLSQRFPNVSIVDVRRNVDKILLLLDYLSQLLKGMSLLSFVVGLIILSTIASFETHRQIKDINLLKILGLSLPNLKVMTLLHFGFLSLVSCLIGVALCFAISFILSQQLFEGSWMIPWRGLLLSSLAVLALSCGIALVSVWKILRVPPKEILFSS